MAVGAGIAILMITIFFITSADSGSLVIDMLASGGDPNPPVWSRVMWASLIGAVAIGLMLAGGLQALQTGAILTAVPFSAIMVAMAVATYMALKAEHREIVRLARRARLREWQTELAEQVTDDLVEHFDQHFAEPVDERISLAFDDRDVEDPPPVPR